MKNQVIQWSNYKTAIIISIYNGLNLLHSPNTQNFRLFVFWTPKLDKMTSYKWRSRKNVVACWSASLISIGTPSPFTYFKHPSSSFSSNLTTNSCGNRDIMHFRWLLAVKLKWIHDVLFLKSFKSTTLASKI